MKTIERLALVVMSVAVSIILSPAMVWAATGEKDNDNRNPIGCLDVGYQFELKTLHLLPQEAGVQQSMYFIFNQLDESVNLYQMRDADGRTLYLNHTINQPQWGVFSTGEKELKFICTVKDPNFRFGRVVDCTESLRVCEFTNVKYGMNNRGNYWLVNSYSRNAAINAVIHYGIIPDYRI